MTAPGRSLLFLAKYGRRAASTRFRFLQYFPRLQAAGLRCDLSPLLDDRYLDAKLDFGRLAAGVVAAGYLRRLAALTTLRRYDAVVLYKEAMPYLPAVYEALVRRLAVPYVYDFDDAYFHSYDLHRNPLVRATLGRKIARVIAGASLVLAGNEYLAEYARRHNDEVEILPTVVDTTVFTPSAARPDASEVVVGWIGSPSTASYLLDLKDVWPQVLAPGRARLVTVGSGPIDLGPIPLTVVPWSEETEIAELQRFDIGIMPLRDDPWSRGKCGFKLIEYMACGVPVVASPVGVNSRIVATAGHGFLCRTTDEWVDALRALIADASLRKRMGARARDEAVASWSLDRWGPVMTAHLLDVAGRRGGR